MKRKVIMSLMSLLLLVGNIGEAQQVTQTEAINAAVAPSAL